MAGKWFSDITISANLFEIPDLRDYLMTSLIEGTTISIECNAHEPIFGPEFDYSSAIECCINDSEGAYSTANLNNSIPTSWSIPLTLKVRPDFLYSLPASLPDLRVENVERKINAKYLKFDYFSATSGNDMSDNIGFGYDYNITTIKYSGDFESISKAKIYLTMLRDSSFTLTNSLVWLFDRYTFSDSVYVLSFSDEGPLDRACLEYSISVTYAKV